METTGTGTVQGHHYCFMIRDLCVSLFREHSSTMTRLFSHTFTNVHRQVRHRGKATRTFGSEAFALNSVGLFPEVPQQ